MRNMTIRGKVFRMVAATFVIGATSEALTGRLDDRFESRQVCQPYGLATIDRALQVISAVIRTPEYEACVRDRISDTGIACPLDPFFGESLTSHGNHVMNALWQGTHMEPNCDMVTSENAGDQGYGGDDIRDWHAGFTWTWQH